MRKAVLISIIALVCIFAGLIVIAGNIFPAQAQIQITAADQIVNVLGSKIRYRMKDGIDPPLILLHGFGGDLSEWSKVQPELSPNKSISIDIIGFGGSDRPDIRYNLDQHKKYIKALLEQLHIERAILVGRSMGASVAAYTAAGSADRVIGVVLIAPSGVPGSLSQRKPFDWLYTPGLLNSFSMLIVNNAIYRAVYPNSLASQALSVTSTYSNAFTESLSHITQPTLLAWSPGDTTTLYKYHSEYLKRIKNLKFITLPDSVGHVTVRSYPDGTARFINDFVATVK